jgi:PEGA domain
MKRTQLITLLLVLFTGIGFASAKPKVAVLGLEVLDKANAKASIDAARQLTEGLRLAAKTSGPFDVADNSQREFLDEKIINQCESEQRECLLKIAGNFGATSLVYGKLQLTENKKSFQVTVFLLAADKGAAKPAITSVPVTSSPQDLQTAGKKIYNELVGVGSVGSIVIKAKTSKGIVYINGDMRGQLVDGELKATQLADGEYKVKITADGFKKWEETVKVKAGQATVVEPDLEAEAKPAVIEPEDKGSRPVTNDGGGKDPYKLETRENTISHGGSRTGWKIAAVGGAVIAAGSMGVWVWQRSGRESNIDDLKALTGPKVGFKGAPFPWEGCDASKGITMNPSDDANALWEDACGNSRNMWIAGTVASLAGAFAAFAVYKGYISSDESESQPTASTRRARKPRFAFTPVMSPDGGGASMRIDF